jgi:hypothetical protein
MAYPANNPATPLIPNISARDIASMEKVDRRDSFSFDRVITGMLRTSIAKFQNFNSRRETGFLFIRFYREEVTLMIFPLVLATTRTVWAIE